MSKKGFPSFFFIAIFLVVILPKLAGFLPIIIFSWFAFRFLFGSPKSRRPTKENPYRTRYEKKYGISNHSRYDPYGEPESYRPKNYSYGSKNVEAKAAIDEPLENPWQKKKSTHSPEQVQRKKHQSRKEKYKPAPISKQEKQSFTFYFIPFLIGALAVSVAMHMGFAKIVALGIGGFLTLIIMLIIRAMRGNKRKKVLSENELIFEQGQSYVMQIAQISEQMDYNPSLQWEIQEIANIVNAIYENFKEDPSDIDRNRNFIKYNLPEAIKLIEGYAKISARSRHQNISADNKAPLQKAEEAIITIRESFEKLEQDMLTNDLMDLEVQSRTIKTVLQNNLHFIKE